MSSDIIEKKKALRKQINKLKSKVLLSEKISRSKLIWNEVESDEGFKSAKTIMLYWSMDDEVYTHEFIQKWCKQKQIILPCINGNELELRVFSDITEMEPGAFFNILEPTGKIFEDTQLLNLIIVPGVAFDKQNNRMGRGRGYYDKLLSTTNAYKMGVCFNFQLLNEIPVEPFDIKMDTVISEK